MLNLQMKDLKITKLYSRVSQKFGNILVRDRLQHVYHETKAVQAMEGTCCDW